MKSKLTHFAASLIVIIGAYLLLSFSAWSFDFREWHWLLRLTLTGCFYLPFNRQSLKKIL